MLETGISELLQLQLINQQYQSSRPVLNPRMKTGAIFDKLPTLLEFKKVYGNQRNELDTRVNEPLALATLFEITAINILQGKKGLDEIILDRAKAAAFFQSFYPGATPTKEDYGIYNLCFSGSSQGLRGSRLPDTIGIRQIKPTKRGRRQWIINTAYECTLATEQAYFEDKGRKYIESCFKFPELLAYAQCCFVVPAQTDIRYLQEKLRRFYVPNRLRKTARPFFDFTTIPIDRDEFYTNARRLLGIKTDVIEKRKSRGHNRFTYKHHHDHQLFRPRFIHT